MFSKCRISKCMRISYPINHICKGLGSKERLGEGRIERCLCVWNLEQCWGATEHEVRAMVRPGHVTPPAELMKYRLIALLTVYLHLSPSLFQPPSPCRPSCPNALSMPAGLHSVSSHSPWIMSPLLSLPVPRMKLPPLLTHLLTQSRFTFHFL